MYKKKNLVWQNGLVILLAIFIVTLMAGCTPTESLVVERYTTASITNGEVDTILSDATTVLKTNDGAGDVACSVQFARDGDVATFPVGDGSIDSQAEFNTIIGLPGEVAVVNQINWCGGLIPNVIGCAPIGGTSLAVVRYTASQEGILWAHEYGHNSGLNHRNDDATAVMNGVIQSTHRRITETECDAYQGQAKEAPATGAEPLSVDAFVRQTFIHGVPYEEASRYDETAVPVLLDMLNDPAEEPYWANIAVVLNIVGNEDVVQPLITFIEEDDGGQLSRDHYIAKTSALMSMGYLINRTGSEEAFNYLVESLSPAMWVERGTESFAPFQAAVAEGSQDLSKHALLGLALAGTPDAADALRSLQSGAAPESGDAEFQTAVSDIVAEALAVNATIESEGLLEYYRSATP